MDKEYTVTPSPDGQGFIVKHNGDAWTGEDNAKRIAKALNHHDELVAALSGLMPWMNRALSDDAFRECVLPRSADKANNNAFMALKNLAEEDI